MSYLSNYTAVSSNFNYAVFHDEFMLDSLQYITIFTVYEIYVSVTMLCYMHILTHRNSDFFDEVGNCMQCG